MFVIVPTCIKPPGEAGQLPDNHGACLDRNCQAGRFIASGRRNPRTGGMLARAASTAEAHATAAENPFIRAGAAEHEAIEFLASRGAAGSETLR